MKRQRSSRVAIACHHRHRKQRLGPQHTVERAIPIRAFHRQSDQYGIPAEDAIQVDGNDVLAVYHAVKDAAESIRQHPRPILLEFKTFRMRGHEEGLAPSITQKG